MKKITLLTLAATTIICSCSMEDRVTDLPPGKYENTVKSTDAAGTDIKRKTSTNVTVDEYGRKKAVVETDSSQDPRGLFNKSKTTSTEVIEEK